MNNAAPILPPRADGLCLFPCYTGADWKRYLVGHFLGFVTSIDAGCVDGDAERIEFRFSFLVAD